LNNTGELQISNETVRWDVVNQYTKAVQTITLPKFMVGTRWLGKNANMNKPSLIVDKVKNLVGGTCTIFQRMNEAGDMLRVSTNVVKLNHSRAIGTFIPDTNPDGKANPVVSEVLQGKTFHGRAFVVNRWYITAYEPIYNATHRVIGMLYVGIPQENVKSLRHAIVNTTIGKTGYVYVLDSQGHYVISRNGEQDDKDILNVKDANGKYPIKEIVRKALALQPDQTAEQTYYWKNPNDPKPRLKIARIVYFRDWDWIICAGAYSDEFRQSEAQIAQISRTDLITLAAVIVITIFATLAIWRMVAGGIVKPIEKSVEFAEVMANGDFTQQLTINQGNEIGVLSKALNKMTESISSMIGNVIKGVTTMTGAATDLSTISEQMNQNSGDTAQQCRTVASAAEEMSTKMNSIATASEQASANVQMVATAAEEISVTLSEIAKNSDKAKSITDVTVQKAESATKKVNELGISAKEINRVTEVITEISEQTNLLALNATIEAARAGEAGKGFAIVANEIKELATQTAQATAEIKTKINGIQNATELTVSEIGEISQVINDVNNVVSEIATAVDQQSATTREIAQNIAQASQGIHDVNENINQSSANSVEIAKEINDVNQANDEMSSGSAKVLDSSRELSQLAVQLDQLISQFKIA
jgi:methyl-accepting chemotaxis protein